MFGCRLTDYLPKVPKPAPVSDMVHEHLEKALECLTDEFNAGRAGPSGLRAQAIAHVRVALLLEDRRWSGSE